MKIKTTLLLALFALALFPVYLFAATANPSPASSGYTPLVIPIQGTYSSTSLPGIVKFTAPAKYKVVSANAVARAVTGTNPTLGVTLKSGTSTLFSGSLAAAGAVTDLTAGTTTNITDESTVAVDLAAGGTSPKWRDLTLFVLLKRL